MAPEIMATDGKILQKHGLKIMGRIFRNGNLAHAWLLAGQEGTGKEQLARIMASLLMCEDPNLHDELPHPCGKCSHCGKLSRGTHPDLHVTVPDGAFIKLAQIHELQKNISYPPLEAKNRAVLILHAHKMNREAANALLKTLEEPPENTFLILTSKGVSSLLPTIVSRCQHISCAGVALEDIAELVRQEHEISEDMAIICARLSDGSLTRAKEMAVSGLEFRKLFLAFLSLPDKERFRHFFELSAWISKNNEQYMVALNILKAVVRDLLLLKSVKNGQNTSMFTNSDMISCLETFAAAYSHENLCEHAARLEEMERLSHRNLRKEMLANSMLAFWARGRCLT